MATVSEWIEGARPRTLPAALAPVLIGTGAAYAVGRGSVLAALLALVVALAMQVGVNYANDYSDGIRGTDTVRVGPIRLVGQQLAAPAQVKRAAVVSFGVGALAGLVLCARSGAWWIVLLGAAAIAAAWFYTGGRHPYGYLGLGEVFVFLFFGLVATLGTTYTQVGWTTQASWAGAVGVGALSCAILMVNNLRDIPGDTIAGKRTLAVRLGDSGARTAYVALLAVAALCLPMAAFGPGGHRGALLGALAFLLAVAPVRRVRTGERGPGLVPVLSATGKLTLAYGVLLGSGIALFPTPLA